MVVKPIRGLIEATIAANVAERSGNTHPVMIINASGAHYRIDGARGVRHARATLRRSRR